MSVDPVTRSAVLEGYSYAEIDRICVQTIKAMIIDQDKQLREREFNRAIEDEARRRAGNTRLIPGA